MKINPPLESAQNSDKFTLDYFCEQIVEFRQRFGDMKFWTGPKEKRDLAAKALSFVYLNLTTENQGKDFPVNLFTSTMEEYTKREGLLLMAGKILPD